MFGEKNNHIPTNTLLKNTLLHLQKEIQKSYLKLVVLEHA